MYKNITMIRENKMLFGVYGFKTAKCLMVTVRLVIRETFGRAEGSFPQLYSEIPLPQMALAWRYK